MKSSQKLKPIICFYKDQYILSTDYKLLSCPENISKDDFLKNVETDYFEQLKIIQIDFLAFQQPKAQCNVFVLNTFEEITVDQLKQLTEVSKSSSQTSLNLDKLSFQSQIKKSEFIDKVKKILSDIACGRFYQVNLTAYLQTSLNLTDSLLDLDIFLHYFEKFKAQYSALIPLTEHSYLSFSPELFLLKKENHILTRPIKGTVSSEQSDTDLLRSEKEAAELSMIVDLLRNDLQMVCETPVQVSQHRSLLKLSYVNHTYSEISGKTSRNLPYILKCMMPAGSISGCPKAESLLAISEYENYDRGFYTGHIGWWLKNDFELNIAIRSFSLSENKLKYFAGCGIVYDSIAENEWKELLQKSSRIGRIFYEE